MERSYRQSTRLLGVLLALLGVAMVATTLARGGGPLAIGVVVGVLFTVLGLARAYLASGVEPRRDPP
jgi:hypothetical protein